jgi:hypothetical protein
MPRSCRRGSAKKYSSRPSPPYPANDCPGMTRYGNNKELWLSTPDKNGVHHWKKKPPAKRRRFSKKATAKRSAKR